MKHTISALMENRPGVLRRLAGLFGRRGYNIDSIVASTTEDHELTRMTIVVDCSEELIEQVLKQMSKLQEIREVENVTDAPVISRQLLILKLKSTINNRGDILQLAQAFRAKVADIRSDSVIIEATAEDSVMESMIETFRPYGIISMMKTGTVVLKK
ncbi:MAG: acetolactate synthase small subunit [Clostridia bacterium]|nr:acetolactate synthase small subunit [Clostridia bacterium]